jgi:hypothetical protein
LNEDRTFRINQTSDTPSLSWNSKPNLGLTQPLRLIILCVENIFLSEANLGIGARPPEGSLNFSCFAVILGSVKNIEERLVHTVPETVSTIVIPKLDSHDFQIVATILMDQIWLAKNQLIYKAIKLEISTILKKISLIARSYSLAWLNSISYNEHWNPFYFLFLGSLKANFDVSTRLN